MPSKVIRCEGCNAKVTCSRFTNTCYACQLDYGMKGQRLAPRSQWGLETGESVADVLSVDRLSVDELLEG